RLLRPRRERPRRRAAEQRDELAPRNHSITSSAAARSVNGTVRPSTLVRTPSEFLLSKMKIAMVVRQLDRGHILWCGRVVRVERAAGIGGVRGVRKMLDVGRHGVIEFGHIRFVARDHVVTYVFREAHYRARDIESLGKVWPSRSMSPARVTQQRRQNRRIVWDDRARMGAAVICELEVSQLGYVRMRMGRV